jgi:hypothetical protein
MPVAQSETGRPTKYTEDKAQAIITRIMGGESCAAIMRDPAMPAQSTLYYWLAQNDEFSERYARALEYRTHQAAEKRFEVLAEYEQKAMEAEGVHVSATLGFARERLRAIEWDAERLAANKYKPRQGIEHSVTTGDIGDALGNLAAD